MLKLICTIPHKKHKLPDLLPIAMLLNVTSEKEKRDIGERTMVTD